MPRAAEKRPCKLPGIAVISRGKKLNTKQQPVSLVLLPGLDGTGVLFRPLLGALPQSLAVSVVSYPPDQPLDYEALLPLVMAALPVAAPFVLLGESFSGPLALQVAACRPAGLLGVVLSASFYRSPHPYLPSWVRALARPALMRIVPQFSQVKALLGGYSTEGIRLLVREALAPVTPEVLACRLRAVLDVDASAALRQCPVPLLYLRGARDFVVPRWNANDIQRLLPATAFQVLPAPHLVLQTQPQLAAGALVQFIASIGAV